MARPRIPARKTTYKGIEMRSRLEARFAAILDNLGVSWSYEGQAYASPRGQYLPDFVVNRNVFIEVKPFIDVDGGNPYAFLDKMAVILDSRVGTETTPGEPASFLPFVGESASDLVYWIADRDGPLEIDWGYM